MHTAKLRVILFTNLKSTELPEEALRRFLSDSSEAGFGNNSIYEIGSCERGQTDLDGRRLVIGHNEQGKCLS